MSPDALIAAARAEAEKCRLETVAEGWRGPCGTLVLVGEVGAMPWEPHHLDAHLARAVEADRRAVARDAFHAGEAHATWDYFGSASWESATPSGHVEPEAEAAVVERLAKNGGTE